MFITKKKDGSCQLSQSRAELKHEAAPVLGMSHCEEEEKSFDVPCKGAAVSASV